MPDAVERDWAARVAAIDRRLQPVADRPVNQADPNWAEKLRGGDPLDEAGVREEAQDVLHELLDAYATGDERTRDAIRSLFGRFSAFAWATTVRSPRTTREGARVHLLHFSVLDQGKDPRDAKLWLDGMVDDARRAGVAIEALLNEVAELSSRQDRYSWGSTRDWLIRRLPPR
jgi:hypothetical protein